MRSRIAGATRCGRFNAFPTVAVVTPAILATSCIPRLAEPLSVTAQLYRPGSEQLGAGVVGTTVSPPGGSRLSGRTTTVSKDGCFAAGERPRV